jgi:hypothetical protein
VHHLNQVGEDEEYLRHYSCHPRGIRSRDVPNASYRQWSGRSGLADWRASTVGAMRKRMLSEREGAVTGSWMGERVVALVCLVTTPSLLTTTRGSEAAAELSVRLG